MVMYPEKKSFPAKIIIVLVLILLIVIGFVIYNSLEKSKNEKAYTELLVLIAKAGVAYGEDNGYLLEEMEGECVPLEQLIKLGYLKSDSKDEYIIYNPKTKEKMSGNILVRHDESKEITAEYLFDKPCYVDYQDKVTVIITDETTSSFIVKVEGPQGLKLNSFEYKIDEKESFEHDTPTYTFSGQATGRHEVVVKAKDYLGNTYEKKAFVVLKELVAPEVEYVENENKVTITCPETLDSNIKCVYTTDDINWEVVEEVTKDIIFEESGKIIVKVTDGHNSTPDIVQEVTVEPKCEDTEWSECTGCTAACNENCEGVQTSNCSNERSCLIIGTTCVSSSSSKSSVPPVVEYEVTVKTSNGTPTLQKAKVKKDAQKTFTINPNKGYVYSSVECNKGKATYSTRTKLLTVSKVTSPRTCTVYFTKEVILPTKHVVTFVDFNGKTITSKEVESGKPVSRVTAPEVSGYTFVAWTLNGSTFNFDTPIYANITLNATYKIQSVIVKFDSNKGTTVQSQYIPIGSQAYEPAKPTRSGYKFTKWTLNGATYDFSSPVTKPITLFANWIPLSIRTVTMPGTKDPVTITLSNFTNLENLNSNCKGGFDHEIEGNVITLTTKTEERCLISIIYY